MKFRFLNRYLFSFAIPILIFHTMLCFLGIVPYGENTLLQSDLYRQYIPFIYRFQDIIRQQDWSSLLYLWCSGNGLSSFGMFAYYVLSPLNLISFFFPIDALSLSHFAWVIISLKIGLMGLSQCLYLNQCYSFNRSSRLSVLTFSTAYALMGFVAAYHIHIMWLDTLYLLPFAIWMLQRLIHHQRWKGFTISLILLFITNFYLSWMVGLFLALYLLYYLLTHTSDSLFSKSHLLTYRLFVRSTLIALGLTAWLWLPTFLQLQHSTTSVEEFKWFNLTLFESFPLLFIQTPKSHLIGTVYISIPLLILSFQFFLDNRHSKRYRVLTFGFLILLCLGFWFQPINLLWHGFKIPSGMPHRFSFLISWFLLDISFFQYQHCGLDVRHPSWKRSWGLCILFFITNLLQLYSQSQTWNVFWLVVNSLALLLVSLFFILPPSISTLTFFVFLELSNNLIFSKLRFSEDMNITPVSFIQAQLEHTELLSTLPTNTRYHSRFLYGYNESFFWNRHQVNQFNTFSYKKNNLWLRSLCIGPASYTFPEYGMCSQTTPLVDLFYNISFVATESQNKREEFIPIFTELNVVDKIQTTVSLSPYGIGIGFPVSEDSLSLKSISPSQNSLDYQNYVAQTFFKTLKQQTLFQQIPLESTPCDEPNTDCFQFNTSSSDPHYFDGIYLFPSEIFLNEVKIDSLFEYGYSYIPPLSENHLYHLQVVYPDEEPSKGWKYWPKDSKLYAFNQSLFDTFIHELKPQAITPISSLSTNWSAKVHSQQDQLYYLAFPYDKGWTVYDNGEVTETLTNEQNLMFIRLTEGTHHLDFVFFPIGLKQGILISAITLSFSTLIWLGSLLYHTKRKDNLL